jgi:V8-like Glu-specific endopeptidase
LLLAAGPSPAVAGQLKGPPVQDPAAGLATPLWVPGSAPTANRALRFVSIPKYFKKGQVQLSNGKAAVNTKDWRAVAVAPDTGNGACTLTLIGPRVALLAAHCVDAGFAPNAPGRGTIAAEAIFDKQVYDLGCDMDPTYRSAPVNPVGAPRSTADFALCDVDRKNSTRSALDEVAPESVSTAINLPAGSQIQMMGYGCTHLGISQDQRYTYDPPDGTLNMEHERIQAAAVSIFPGVSGIYVRTTSADGGPTLCYGDSGGPVMTAASAGPGRRLVAVNSAMGATPTATSSKPAFYSYMAPLGSQAFRTFAEHWAEQTNLPAAQHKDRRICGIPGGLSAGTGGCRQ